MFIGLLILYILYWICVAWPIVKQAGLAWMRYSRGGGRV